MSDTLLFPAAALLVFTSAAIYGFGFLNGEVGAWRSFWKTLPVAAMAGFVALAGAPLLLVLALSLSAMGDFFLSRSERRFTLGLVAFLIAHLAYIWIFWQMGAQGPLGWGQGVMVVYAVVFGLYLWPRAGDFRGPVLAYILVITLMVGAAFWLPAGYGMVLTGVLFFALSDSLLALEMFVVRNPAMRVFLSKAVWVSYILAQGLIVLGLGAG
ncbi:MAG: lysoplasmalogenase [Rhodobacteraceae bacterium]|nr:lysoplasmalogenase [Paracoccaceae bacterium]